MDSHKISFIYICPFVRIRNQKEYICIAKGLLLGSKRTRFEQQKESFCKAKGLHFDYLIKIHELC